MSLILREATLDDAEQLCDVHFSAFSEEPVSLQTLPRESGTGRAFWKLSIISDIKSPETHVLVICDEKHSGSIIALAKWKQPGSVIKDTAPAHLWPQDGNPQLGAHFFGRFVANHREIMGDQPHWFLELLCTDKKAAGRGAARKLMEWGLERADRDGLPTYLEATPEAEPIYIGKFGFRPVKREKIDIGTGVVDTPFMIREPRTKP